ncbi:hypothetical protein BGZ76_009820 [Entomortierella beljakovae]|nr:hypothetical protein BGZ76_009820 [Entomortierella beljakovae]
MEESQEASTSQGRYYHDKKAFINAQIRLLEAPMQPPTNWKRHRPRLTSEGETQTSIPDAVIQTALSKLHAASKKSSRLTFNSQTVRQLLEQLESNQYELRKKARHGGIVVRTKSKEELLESDWIEMFPETWRQEHSQEQDSGSSVDNNILQPDSTSRPLAMTPSSLKLQKYADVRSRIVALQSKYQALKDKHDYYKTLQTEVRRLDAGEIQKNILSSDSSIVDELEKMKELLPKVIKLLTSSQDVLTAKRKYSESENEMVKKQRFQPTDPLQTMMDFICSEGNP